MTHLRLPLQARVNHSQKKPSESLVCGWGLRKWQTAEVEVYVTPLKMLVRMALLAVGLVLNKVLKECVNEFFFYLCHSNYERVQGWLWPWGDIVRKAAVISWPISVVIKIMRVLRSYLTFVSKWQDFLKNLAFFFLFSSLMDLFWSIQKCKSGDAGHGQHSF